MLNRRRRSNEHPTSRKSRAPKQESAVEAPGAAQNAGGAPRGRASWKGLLQFRLVVVPVKAYPAVSTTDDFHFNQLHAGCGERIRYQKHCPVHGEVNNESIVRGYQYAPGQYVLVETSELEKLRPPKERGLVLEQFVDAERIDPVLFSGRSLYLFPEGLPAQRPYRVLAEALRCRGKWAVGRVTMSGHRHLVAVRPAGRLLAMHVLHNPQKVRAVSWLEAELGNGASSQEEQQLACTLIDSATAPVDWSQYRDDTAEKLSALIQAKIEHRQVVAPAEEPVEVPQLLDALKQSVAAAVGSDRTAKSKNGKRSLLSRWRSA